MKKITKNNSTSKKIRPRTENDWEDYLNTISLQMEPANDAFRERLAYKLITWVKEDKKAFTMDQFFNITGVDDSVYYRWLEKSEKLKAAHKFALRQLGINRELLCLERNLTTASVAAFTLPRYSSSWKTEYVERAKLKNDDADGSQPKIVVIEAFDKPESEALNKIAKTPEEVVAIMKEGTPRPGGSKRKG